MPPINRVRKRIACVGCKSLLEHCRESHGERQHHSQGQYGYDLFPVYLFLTTSPPSMLYSSGVLNFTVLLFYVVRSVVEFLEAGKRRQPTKRGASPEVGGIE